MAYPHCQVQGGLDSAQAERASLIGERELERLGEAQVES